MGVVLKRNLTSEQSLQPGEYYVDHLKHERGTMIRVSICCQQCGAISRLNSDHTIHRGGLVTPIWSCQMAPCSVLDWVQLDDFGEKPT